MAMPKTEMTYENSLLAQPTLPFEISPVDNRIEGRLALVTGASGGIGRATAQELAREGCHCALTYSSNKAAAETLADELRKAYPNLDISTHQADLSTSAFLDPLIVSLAAAHPNMPVSVFVANAGHGVRVRYIEDCTEEEYDLNQAVNTKSTWLILKRIIPAMKEQMFGRIIMISSVSQHGAGVNGCQYSASKGAITAMGKNLATVLMPWRITVNSISPALIGGTYMIPSAIATSSTPGQADDKGLMIAKMVPMQRLGTPHEIALVVAMFAKVGFCTGQDLTVGGGVK